MPLNRVLYDEVDDSFFRVFSQCGLRTLDAEHFRPRTLVERAKIPFNPAADGGLAGIDQKGRRLPPRAGLRRFSDEQSPDEHRESQRIHCVPPWFFPLTNNSNLRASKRRSRQSLSLHCASKITGSVPQLASGMYLSALDLNKGANGPAQTAKRLLRCAHAVVHGFFTQRHAAEVGARKVDWTERRGRGATGLAPDKSGAGSNYRVPPFHHVEPLD